MFGLRPICRFIGMRRFFTVGTQEVPIEITTLNPDSADLHYRGFSEMYRPNAHAPHLFDYEKVTTDAQWRDPRGVLHPLW